MLFGRLFFKKMILSTEAIAANVLVFGVSGTRICALLSGLVSSPLTDTAKYVATIPESQHSRD